MSSKLRLIGMILIVFLVSGCSLFNYQSTIEPPEGCRSCHVEPIKGNWHVLLKPAALHDELDSGHLEQEINNIRPVTSQMRPCFVCHHSPDGSHLFYKGNFSH